MGAKPFRYIRADVMPLFAAVAVGIGAAGTIITRKLFAVRTSMPLTEDTPSDALRTRQHTLSDPPLTVDHVKQILKSS